MRTGLAAGADGTTLTTTFDRVAVRPVYQPVVWPSLPQRLLRIIGRAAMSLPASTWMLVDVGLLSLAVYIAFVAFPPPALLITPHVALWQALFVFNFALVIGSLVFGLYERATVRSRTRILLRMALTSLVATVIAYAIIYVVMYSTVGRRMTALAMGTFVATGVSVRLAAWWVVQRLRSALLVIGSPALYESFERSREEGLLGEYNLVGFASVRGSDDEDNDGAHPRCLGRITHVIDELPAKRVTDIVVGDAAARDPRVMDWMIPCLRQGCRVTNEATFYEAATGQILVDEITPSWFLFADLKVHCDERATLKRAMDVLVAGLGLVLSVPLWPAIALAIKLCDRGPVFYAQERVGQNGEVFTLYKFRTMRPDAENGRSVWCEANDPRVTPVGRLLRRSRLDELPQLWNVLVGQMSLVGPRPERPDIVERLRLLIPFYDERHLVKPGITGWAQISFRYGNTVADAKRKLQFDLYYLKNMSFELDVIILFRTVGTFLRGAC